MRLQVEPDSHADRYVTVDLAGPTACTVDPPSVRTGILARLGPDPIRRGSRPDAMIERISRSSRGIGDLLMDQSVVAGIGNVYRAEVLFVAGIHPLRPGDARDDHELEQCGRSLRGCCDKASRTTGSSPSVAGSRYLPQRPDPAATPPTPTSATAVCCAATRSASSRSPIGAATTVRRINRSDRLRWADDFRRAHSRDRPGTPRRLHAERSATSSRDGASSSNCVRCSSRTRTA